MNFTEEELGLFAQALMKCLLLQEHTGSGKFKLCLIAKKNVQKAAQNGHILIIYPFKFPKTSDDQLLNLLQRLEDQEKLAWLNKEKKNG